MFQQKQPGSGKRFVWRDSFSEVLAAGVNSNWEVVSAGAGMTVSQSAGSLIIASGTTVNSETILRSTDSYAGALTLRYQLALSQRIANHNTYIELVDVIGDDLGITINSATSVTIELPDHLNGFFSESNVGQSMYLGGFTGTAGMIPGRYAIASVDNTLNTITFTVAGFPGSGSGTVDVFGWNYYHTWYDGTSVLSAKFDSQRNGWSIGETTIATNTTVAPGTVGTVQIEDGLVSVFDQLSAYGIASSTSFQATLRASRIATVPDVNLPLVVQIRVTNGSTAPASTTTSTVSFIYVEDYNPATVSITSVRPQALNSALPVTLLGGTPSTILGQVIPGISGTPSTGTSTLINRLIAAATVNNTLVKASQGRLVAGQVTNVSAAVKYLKFYNKATAPVAGTDTPVLTIPLPVNVPVNIADIVGIYGFVFTTGIGFALTGLQADADVTALAAGDVVANIIYV